MGAAAEEESEFVDEEEDDEDDDDDDDDNDEELVVDFALWRSNALGQLDTVSEIRFFASVWLGMTKSGRLFPELWSAIFWDNPFGWASPNHPAFNGQNSIGVRNHGAERRIQESQKQVRSINWRWFIHCLWGTKYS
jgi:hypothetical protein